MSEEMMLKLVESMNKLAAETVEVNMLIRRMDFNRDTLNKINERNDAMHAALIHIEKGLKLDDRRIIELEAQTGLLRETLEQQKKQRDQLEQTVYALNKAVQANEAGIKVQVAKIGAELAGRIGTVHESLFMWLMIVGGALLVILAILILTH
jgi:predicted RNase H-like nuclease (RuvC/YqgF family)